MKHPNDTMVTMVDLAKSYSETIADQKQIIEDLERNYEKLALEHEALQNKYNSLMRKKNKTFGDFPF